MAKRKIIWTKSAKSERLEILNYWINKTKSKSYSTKLNLLFNQSINLLSDYPEIGRKTNDSETRISIVRDYFIFYEFTEHELVILSV